MTIVYYTAAITVFLIGLYKHTSAKRARRDRESQQRVDKLLAWYNNLSNRFYCTTPWAGAHR